MRSSNWIYTGYSDLQRRILSSIGLLGRTARVRARMARRFLKGSGIEIGALHNPLKIESGVRVRYVDRLCIEKLHEHYPELSGCKIIPPDIVDDGETLSSIKDGTLDFIIANHMLEHCENPLGTIRNHLRKIRSGGVLYYAVPEKTRSFDSRRPVTSFAHLMDDDQHGSQNSRAGHFHEWVTSVNKVNDPAMVADQINKLTKLNYSIHFHVWDELNFRTFIQEAYCYLGKKFEIICLIRNGSEMIAVLRKP